MEDIKSLVTKQQANAGLESTKNLSGTQQPLTPRQMAISGLIQKTQAYRGLPLMSAGIELRVAISAWELALKNIPDEYLVRAYQQAAENWPWADKPFTPQAVADAYKILVVEDRQRAEADKRNARRKDDTYRCFHCCDVGYQTVFYYSTKRWYSSQRPCCCEAAPVGQRQEFPLGPAFVRNKLGEYARQCDIEKHGVPNDAFNEFVSSK